MIQDRGKWNLGVSALSGFMQHLPSYIDEECVQQFHSIVSLLEEASGEDLSLFRIPAERLAPRITSVTRGGYGGGSGSATYSKKKYCDSAYFRSQVHGLSNYLTTLRGGSAARKENPYESLTDDQLQDMLINRKINPKRVVDQRGEHWVYDRAHAIVELLKSDQPQNLASVSNVFNIHDSNFINSSPGASITQTVGFKGEELQKVLAELKQFSAARDFSNEDRAQMDSDIATIELQIASPRPNHSIIRSCLESAQSIVEHAAGVVVGESVLIAIKHYLHIP
jgi:hypothetical protein